METTGFLVDQMLPIRLANDLLKDFPGTVHVKSVGLSDSDDVAIAEFADEHGLAVLSKDSDFDQLASLEGSPRKAVRIAVGNVPNDELLQIIQDRASTLKEFLAGPDRLLVVMQAGES
jgi:predicted nuclease of predicted toxin-antitoxin system